MLEKQIENPVVKWAKAHDIKVKKKVFAEQLDRWFFFPQGHLFIIEFKVPGKRLTPLQQLEIEELKQLGYDVEVHDDKDAAIKALKERIPNYFITCSRIVEAPPIPERFCALAPNSRVRGAVRRSGDRENFYNPCRFKRS